MIAKSTFVKASIHWWEWWWVLSRGLVLGYFIVRGQRRENFGGFTEWIFTKHGETILFFRPFLSAFLPFSIYHFLPNFRIPFSQRFRASVLFYLRSLSGIVAASGTISISAKLHDKATDIRATDYKWLEAARRIVATGDEAAIVVHYC